MKRIKIEWMKWVLTQNKFIIYSAIFIFILLQYHQYNNPVAMVGTFPRDSRPKDLRLGNGNTSTIQRTTDVELNGLAIKERLMANRLPESCV